MKTPKKRICRISSGLIFMLMLTFMAAGSAMAEPKHWEGITRDWNEGGNWNPTGVPVRGEAVLIDRAGDQVDYNNPLNPTLKSLQINNKKADPSLTTSTQLNQNALKLTTEKTEIGLDTGESHYNHAGGIHRILIGNLYNNRDSEKGNLNIGVGLNASGNYNLVDAVLSVAGHEKVGIAGVGYMNQETSNLNSADPTLQCAPPNNPPPVTPPPVEPVHTIGKNLYLGFGNTIEENEEIIPSTGYFNMSAGSLTVGGSIRVGNLGIGYFNQTNGTVTVKGNDPTPLQNGLQSSNGAGFSNLIRKRAATPALECHNTGKNPGLIVGVNNYGEYALDRGTLNVNYSEIIGWGAGSDDSFFLQKDGIHKIAGNLIIAQNAANLYNYFSLVGTSIYDRDENSPLEGLVDVGGFTSVGYAGYGEFLQDGGKLKVRGYDPELVNFSLQTASSGTPSLQCSTTQRNYIGLTIGREGSGGYFLKNGELLVSRGEAIGVFDGSEGYFQQNSGSHYVGGTLTIALGQKSTGLYDFYDGLLAARGGLVNNGTFNMFSGVLQAKVTNKGRFEVSKPVPPDPDDPTAPVQRVLTPSIVGDFHNQEGATITLKETKVKFGTQVYNNGTINSVNSNGLISEPIFKNLTVNEKGVLDLSSDKITVTGNLINKSASPSGWDTKDADVVFSGPGTHYFKTGSKVTDTPFENNFAWGGFGIEGGAVVRLQGHLVADKIQGVIADSDQKITNMYGYCGIMIYYTPANSPDISEGMKLFSPWGSQVGHFTATGFVSDCP